MAERADFIKQLIIEGSRVAALGRLTVRQLERKLE